MLIVSAVYPNRAGSRFDGVYYVRDHARFARELLGPRGLGGLRITLGLTDLAGEAPPFWAISEMHFADRATFDAAMAAGGAELMGDAVNFTDVEPVLQISEHADLRDYSLSGEN